MLIKSELGQISVQKCPNYSSKKKKEDFIYCAAAQIIDLPRGGEVLVIDVFEKINSELRMRFFSDGKNFIICKEWPAATWFKSKPSELLRQVSVYSYRSVEATDKNVKAVHEFLKGGQHSFFCYPDGILGEMDSFAYGFYERRRETTWNNKQALMEEHFKMFPAYPADLEEYCDNKVFGNTYFFISKIEKEKREALCGHCKQKFEVDRETKPGNMGICPKCNMPGKYRGAWINGETKRDKAEICITHKVDDQLLIRWTKIWRSFVNTERKYVFEDYYRNLYLKTPKGPVIYAYDYKSIMGYGYDWRRQKNGYVNYKYTFVYPNNLQEVFGEKYYNVNLQTGLQNAGKISFAHLLDNLKNVPPAEYLFKMGLLALASDYIDWRVGEEAGLSALGIHKQYLPMYQRFNINRAEHEIIRASKTFVSEDSFEKFRLLQFNSPLDFADVKKLLNTISFERFVNYFHKQMIITENKYLHEVLILYRDYLSMSEALKVDMSRKAIRFPRNIKDAHDQLLPRFNQIKYKADNKEFRQAVKNGLYAGMRAFNKDGYCIVFPALRSDIISEGQSLGHCVGNENYYKNHIAGTKMIFFVRKAAEKTKPFYTMEIDMQARKISQLYGFKDKPAPPEVKKFANEFLKRLPKREKKDNRFRVMVPA